MKNIVKENVKKPFNIIEILKGNEEGSNHEKAYYTLDRFFIFMQYVDSATK